MRDLIQLVLSVEIIYVGKMRDERKKLCNISACVK